MSVLDNIKEVRLARPTDHVIKQLKDLISKGQLKPGDLLPGERELAARFGLGRGYIREAIKTFELYGVFKSIPGKGTIVSDLSLELYGDFLNNIVQLGMNSYLELMDVREMLEPGVAYRAALNATDAEIRKISESLLVYHAQMKSGVVDIETECRFHTDVANASHNRLLSIVVGVVIQELTNIGKEIDILRDDRPTESYEEHSAIYDAVARRDPEAAHAAMQHHIDKTKEMFAYCMRFKKSGSIRFKKNEDAGGQEEGGEAER